jgi:hypothetical protein
MKHYYYSENDKQVGPFTFEELREKRLKKSTLIWADDLPEWTRADNVEELKDILVSEPPPLPKKPAIIPASNPKYDYNYKKDSAPIVVGTIVILISIILAASRAKINEEDYRNYLAFACVLRIVFTIWSVQIAKNLNRDPVGWGIFAFVLPGIALFVIGLQKKIRGPIKFKKLN